MLIWKVELSTELTNYLCVETQRVGACGKQLESTSKVLHLTQ